MSQGPAASPLACCHGFAVAAGEQRVGVVETPVFSGTALDPVALLMRAVDGIPGTFRIVPASLVVGVDSEEQTIELVASEAEILALHEFQLRDLTALSPHGAGSNRP